MATTQQRSDGGTDTAFERAAAEATRAMRYEHDIDEQIDVLCPWVDMAGLEAALTWAVAPGAETVVRFTIESERLDDADGAAPVPPRSDRAFLFGGDGEDDDPAFAVVGSFVDAWETERVAVETPAPWDTPDDLTPANEVVKSLEWDDHHYSFEERVRERGFEADNVWVLDSSGVDLLRQRARSAGYDWVGAQDGHSVRGRDEEALAELASFVRPAEVDRDEWELVGGDRLTVRYESKQTGSTKTKEGTVTGAGDRDGPAVAFERDDGKTNRLKADGGDVGIYSNSRYPFMGEVRSVEVRTEGDE